jgi:hypothetical protein
VTDERAERAERVERAYALAEVKNEARKEATIRRGPVSLIVVCLGFALLVGITAAVDLRRLQTPEGTALAFAGAAVFGDCNAYRRLALRAADDDRDEDERCLEIRRATQDARDRPADVEIELVSAQEEGDTARAVVRVRRPGDDESEDVPLSMRPRGGGWVVELTERTCAVLACP